MMMMTMTVMVKIKIGISTPRRSHHRLYVDYEPPPKSAIWSNKQKARIKTGVMLKCSSLRSVLKRTSNSHASRGSAPYRALGYFWKTENLHCVETEAARRCEVVITDVWGCWIIACSLGWFSQSSNLEKNKHLKWASLCLNPQLSVKQGAKASTVL